MKALESRQTTHVDIKETTKDPRDKHVPLVKDVTIGKENGMLTSRQKTWMDGFPNDPHVENPVLVK